MEKNADNYKAKVELKLRVKWRFKEADRRGGHEKVWATHRLRTRWRLRRFK